MHHDFIKEPITRYSRSFFRSSLFYWIVLIIISVAVGLFFYREYYKPMGVEYSLGGDKIVVRTLKNGNKLVRNVEEGIQVEVDESWNINIHPENNLTFLYKGTGQMVEDSDLVDGINLSVSILQDNYDASISDWLLKNSLYSKLEIAKMNSLKLKNFDIKSLEQKLDDNDYLPEGINNYRFDYIFIKNNQLVDYSCDIIAKDSEILNYKQKCLNLLLKNL